VQDRAHRGLLADLRAELWESIHVVTPPERKIGRAGAGRQSHKPLDKYRRE
jgi:hypothetical protein